MALFPNVYMQLHFNGENLVTMNAREKNTQAVNEFLSEDPAAAKDAVYGYAWEKHDDEVDALLTAKEDLVPYAVEGYARAGDTDKVLYFTAKYPSTKKNAIYGYAQAGKEHQVMSALRSSHTYLLPAIQGCASTNQKKILLQLLKGTIYYPEAIKVAAKNGQFTLVNELFDVLEIDHKRPFELSSLSDSKKINQFKCLNTALTGFIQGSHFAAAGHLINLGANATHAILELSNRTGGMKEEDAIILLAHINDKSLRKNTLAQILEIGDHLSQSKFDLEELEKINTKIQKGANYLQATATPSDKESKSSFSGDISVLMLNQLLAGSSALHQKGATTCPT